MARMMKDTQRYKIVSVTNLPRAERLRRLSPLLAVLLIALVVRIGVLLVFNDIFAFERTGAVHGSIAYDLYAQNLLATGVYGKTEPGVPDTHLPPLYSYALAAAYGLFGRNHLALAALNIALDLIAIAALYGICARLFTFTNGKAVAMLASLFYALYPYLLFHNLTLIDTPLFMALLYLFLYLIVVLRGQPLEQGGWKLAAASGLILGLLLLTRPNAGIIALVAALWFAINLPLTSAIGRLIPVALVSVAVLTPWIIRNYGVHGVFVPVASNSGENFYQGNSIYTIPYLRAGYDVQWMPSPEYEFEDPFGPQATAIRFGWGLDFLRENPEIIPELLWVKFLVHWSIDVAPARNPTEGEIARFDPFNEVLAEQAEDDLLLGGLPPGDAVGVYSSSLFDQVGRTVHRFYYGGLFFLALLGAALTLPHWRAMSLLWLVQIAMTIAYVLFHPATRYRAPTDPLLFAFSAAALVLIWEWRAARASGKRPVANRPAAERS